MPVTLRYIHPDAAAKLEQLEVGTAVLERVARDLAPLNRRRSTNSRRIRKSMLTAWQYLRPTYLAVRSALVAMDRAVRSPHLATAFRILHGALSEAAKCLLLAFAILFALALVIGLLAPPV